MAIMLAKTYHALKAAGAPEDDAIAAAEELADYQNKLSSIDHELVVLGGCIDTVETRISAVETRISAGREPPRHRRNPPRCGRRKAC